MAFNFFVLSTSCLAFVLCIIILRKSGEAEDSRRKMMKSITSDEVIKIEHAELEQSFYKRFFQPVINKITKVFDDRRKKKNEKNEQFIDEKRIAKIKSTERLLRMAGIHTSYQNYEFAKRAGSIVFVIMLIGIALILRLEILYTVLIIVVSIFAGLFLPNFILKSLVTQHQTAIKKQLPDVLDLISVCMDAGLSFDSALVKVAEKMEGPFIDELITVFRQMQMGVSRADALGSLADSTDIPELKTFVSALIQASTLGIPVNNVMKVQAKQLRETRREEAKEKGNKAPVKMSIPIMIFIFPALFIVILGPTVMTVMGSMN